MRAGGVRNSRKKGSPGFAVFSVMLLLALLGLSGMLIYDGLGESTEYQDIVSISGMEYDEAFLEEAAKIPGIRSLSPVLEISVRMQIGEYEMQTVWQALNVEELSLEVESSAETEVGATPVLLLGENSLAGLQDANGHTVSAVEQKKLLADYESLEVRYCLEAQEMSGQEIWNECRIAGVLRSPSEGIYLDYGQGRQLFQSIGAEISIQKVFLSVRGKSNWKKALDYFGSSI